MLKKPYFRYYYNIPEISARIFLWLITLLLVSCNHQKLPPEVAAAYDELPETIDFTYQVKPILSDRCFACHGPDNNSRKAGLRLDQQASAFGKLQEAEGHPFVAGNLKKSLAFQRMLSHDPEIMMPPPESNLKLEPQEIATIAKWIEQGAPWKNHWAFDPPAKSPLPDVDLKDWPENELDRFILAEMEDKGLQPSPEASKETLIRRVTFDLTGLPPTVPEIDAFLADGSPQAYEKVVDRLLESPHFGERLATEWLDLARYADSHGYQDDGMRNMWPWRDWVIEKFNQNLPFDQFVLWQLAGDMLPNPTREQILATGFNRNHLQSQEGGIVPEEYRVEYVADRAQTFGKAFIGLTIECARCHDHKYDPISQEEYYQLFGFFNNIQETGQIPYMGEASPTIILTDRKADSLLHYLQSRIEPLEQQLNNKQDFLPEFEKWLVDAQQSDNKVLPANRNLIGHYDLELASGEEKRELKNLADPAKPAKLAGALEDLPVPADGFKKKGYLLTGDSHIDMGHKIGYFEKNQDFTVGLWAFIEKEGISGPLFTKSGGLFNGNRGYDFMLEPDGKITASLNHTFPANSVAVETLEKFPVNKWTHFAMSWDGSGKAAGLKIFIDGREVGVKIWADNLQSSIMYYGPEEKSWGGAGNFVVGRRFEETLDKVRVDEIRIYDRRLSSLEIEALAEAGEGDPLQQLLVKNYQELDENSKAQLYEYYLLNQHPGFAKVQQELEKLRGKATRILTEQPEVMVMKELPETRPTYLLERGAYDARGREVKPATPEVVLPFPDKLPKNRLGLAEWLLAKENPLFARVMVNRYWQMVFGKGIVSTPEDFGNQGALPTHPELLDYLAVYFRENGWNLKDLLKQMVLSATYRQSSVNTSELMEADPVNTWLTRAPSYRMSAEMIRDNALAASGLLVPEIGGPPVYPYQPPGLWEQLATRNATVYVQDQGDKLYRRSLYTIWKRTSPPPSMLNFDAAERNFCTVRRQKTSTPLQSLVLMNDPQYLEAARMIGERMLKEGGNDTEKQLVTGFRLLTSRSPDQYELGLLKDFYLQELEMFRSGVNNADEFLQVGEFPADKALDKNQVAALAMVATTLMNYDEAVFKR